MKETGEISMIFTVTLHPALDKVSVVRALRWTVWA